MDNNASASCPNGFASAYPIRPLPRSPKARDRGHPQLDKIGSMRPGPPAGSEMPSMSGKAILFVGRLYGLRDGAMEAVTKCAHSLDM